MNETKLDYKVYMKPKWIIKIIKGLLEIVHKAAGHRADMELK